MTPVERTSTCSGSSPSFAAAVSVIARAAARPCAPVAALATPEFATIACGCAASRWSRDTVTGAACTRLTVNIPAPVAGVSERRSARSSRSCLRMPEWTAPAAKPLAAVTLIRAPR